MTQPPRELPGITSGARQPLEKPKSSVAAARLRVPPVCRCLAAVDGRTPAGRCPHPR